MPTPLLICVKALNGGVFVVLFEVFGERCRLSGSARAMISGRFRDRGFAVRAALS